LAIPMAQSLRFIRLKGANMKRKFVIQGLSLCVGLILVILTSGCATTPRMYTGEALPKERVAIVKGSTNLQLIYFIIGSWSRHTSVLIREVDDKVPYSFVDKCEVLPGLHNVVVEVEQTDETSVLYADSSSHVRRTVSLEFNTIAGHKYQIKIEKGIYLLAVDTHSREVVAKNPIYLGRHSFGDILTLQQRDDLRMSAKASWVEGSCGFGSPQSEIRTRGVLAATDNQLSFLVWNSDKYVPLFEFGYDKIAKAEVRKYGLAKRLVVLSKTKDCYTFLLEQRKPIEIADFISKKIEQE